ncbi:MAG: MBOAT family protein [Bacteroidales bacterium]|nr:MBOAT family protein [Bacteroidales bacterium]
MVFSSTIFLVLFLPAFLLIYFFLGVKLKNLFALAASLLFYAWGAPGFIFIVLASIMADFYLVGWMNKKTGGIKRLLLALSVAINVGLLLYFKYANFFIENINILMEDWGFAQVTWTRIALPIGISFFTFQKLTYSVDVYRKVYHPLRKVTDYALYILMFPQLIAGPIVRFNEIAGQIEDRRANENNNNRLTGFFRFALGLAKKVLIANTLGEQADLVFGSDPAGLSSYTAWIGVIAYAFQIYFDFSGYSDMAIGLGRMAGFDFPENFNNPYISGSITEFWRRWHITLGRWMKDYLYIPLGGNRVSATRIYFNLWVVFLISGLWHGAAWNFVIWGAYHGFFLVAERLFLLKLYKKAGRLISTVWVFFLTLMGWVLFRADNLDHALSFAGSLFSSGGQAGQLYFEGKFYAVLIIGAFFSFWGFSRLIEKKQQWLLAKNRGQGMLSLMTFTALVLFVVCLAYVSSSGFNPFIYFRF